MKLTNKQLDAFERWIEAIILDANSKYIEDAINKLNRRDDLVEALNNND